MESGKLFIGGISWDTNEDRLRDYFQVYGEVVEAVIMKDRATGRARGFGFIVFSDSAVAERVVLEKHIIDGRTVEAKKAVPRDDYQNPLSKNSSGSSSSSHGSPGHTRTKKIFVGGLSSNITETDFKKYFDRYGTITDVVVMYDHNTQRPRGFGFITFDSEESVEKVLLKNFHELNGKMVEVKRAIPKELSPGPNRGQLGSLNNGLGRFSSLLNGYTPGGFMSPPPMGYGVRMEDRLSPNLAAMARTPHSAAIMDRISSNSGIGGNFSSNLSYLMGGPANQLASSNRFNSSSSYLGYGGNSGRIGPLSPPNQSLWANESLISSPTNHLPFIRENGNLNSGGSFGSNNSSIWSGGAAAAAVLNGELEYNNNNVGGSSRVGDISYAPVGWNKGGGGGLFPAKSSSHEGNLFENGYGNPPVSSSAWRSPPPERVGSDPFSFGLGSAASDHVMNMNSAGYGVINKQSIRGIAA